MDLLKLHSITSKLLGRVENIEKVPDGPVVSPFKPFVGSVLYFTSPFVVVKVMSLKNSTERVKPQDPHRSDGNETSATVLLPHQHEAKMGADKAPEVLSSGSGSY